LLAIVVERMQRGPRAERHPQLANMGIRAFIFPSHPHLQEYEIFATKWLPLIKPSLWPTNMGASLLPTPVKPLGVGERR
jgi:hypothetical protein